MKPLEGIKVVELGTHVAVPNATRVMADWGADVIKVEGVTGDLWRYFGANISTPTKDEENPIFANQNTNKRFIALNLKSAEGMEAMHKLLAEADVFVSNVRMKSLSKMGLTYEALSEKYPKLIYFHFTGFGYEGPVAARPGFDVAAFWSRSGMLGDWAEKGTYPINPSSGFGDATVASSVLTGILAALISRNKTGKGMRLTTSLYANAVWYAGAEVVANQPQYGNVKPVVGGRPGNAFASNYKCKDGEWIYIAALEYDNSYNKIMKIMGLDELVDDERFCTQANYRKNRDEFQKIFQAKFMENRLREDRPYQRRL